MAAPGMVTKPVRTKFRPMSPSCCSVKPFASESELQNGNAGGVVLNDERRRGSWGQLAQESLRNRSHLGHSVANIHTGMEKNLDDGNSIQGLRFDVLDIVDRGGQHRARTERRCGWTFPPAIGRCNSRER